MSAIPPEDDPWIVLASSGEDRISLCTCCGVVRIAFGNVIARVTRKHLGDLVDLVRLMLRWDQGGHEPGGQGVSRDIEITFGRSSFILRLSVEELGLFRSLLETAWLRLYGRGEIDWPEVRRALGEINYSGYLTTEIEGGDLAYLKDVSARVDRIIAGEKPVAAAAPPAGAK